MNIPLIHLQGGEVTGSIDESVRHAISKFANIHFPATKLARKNLIRMGEDPATIFNYGCRSIDLAKKITKKRKNLYDILNKYKFSNQGSYNLKKINKYLVVVQHSVTTEYEKTKEHILETIKAISKIDLDCIWLWPNIDSGSDIISKQLRIFREKNLLNKVLFIKNIKPEDFLHLINNSLCIVGNSSAGIRESSFLGVPSVNIGLRQNGREKAKNVKNVGHSSKKIIEKIKFQIKNGKYKKSFIYGKGNAGKRILEKLLKYKIRSTQKTLSYGK